MFRKNSFKVSGENSNARISLFKYYISKIDLTIKLTLEQVVGGKNNLFVHQPESPIVKSSPTVHAILKLIANSLHHQKS